MAYMLTRIDVRDYDAWKPQFDQDRPGARTDSKGWHVMRSIDNPNEVFIQVEFASTDEAKTARERLLASGVLDRFDDKAGPFVAEDAEVIER